jgi:predicted CoA-binding protein
MPGSYVGTLEGMARGDAQTIERVLAYETWAVVGLTTNSRRPAYGVAWFLQQHGKKIVPVNLKAETVHGEQGYASLADVPFQVDVVDVFRRADEAGAHVDEAVAAGAKAVWLQLGVIDEAAADRAAAAGLDVIMDHCPAIEMVRARPPLGLRAGRPAAAPTRPVSERAGRAPAAHRRCPALPVDRA